LNPGGWNGDGAGAGGTREVEGNDRGREMEMAWPNRWQCIAIAMQIEVEEWCKKRCCCLLWVGLVG